MYLVTIKRDGKSFTMGVRSRATVVAIAERLAGPGIEMWAKSERDDAHLELDTTFLKWSLSDLEEQDLEV